MSDNETIKTNFSLMRWMNGTHEALVERVGGTSAWKKLSDYVLGNAVPDRFVRSSIESKLGLPSGWTSRDNLALLSLSEEDFTLVMSVMQLDARTKRALLAFAQAAQVEA